MGEHILLFAMGLVGGWILHGLVMLAAVLRVVLKSDRKEAECG
jgi:uncharacterized membrane protein YciS (DUF1049 family)